MHLDLIWLVLTLHMSKFHIYLYNIYRSYLVIILGAIIKPVLVCISLLTNKLLEILSSSY